MTRLRILAALALLVPAWAALAETVQVRSGAHPGFARLVVEIGAERNWRITREGRSWRMELGPAPPEFDVTGVFTLIGRDRIAEISGGESLRLGLACDCDVRVDRYRGVYAVIDVHDAAPGTAGTQGTAPDVADNPPLPPGPGAAAGVIAALAADPDTGGRRAGPAAPETDLQRLGMAADMLAGQLARAAASGLLEAAPLQPIASADPRPAPPRAPPAPLQMAAPGPAPLPIRALTAHDLASGAPGTIRITPGAAGCLPLPVRPMDTWDGDAPLGHAIGPYRTAAQGADGMLDTQGVVALAELYLAHGFGAEARHWLRQLDDPPRFELALAQYLHGQDMAPFGAAEASVDCQAEIRFWAYLSDPRAAAPPRGDAAAIMRSFTALPAPLRDIAGPDLARKLAGHGHADLARDLRDRIDRADTVAPAERLLLDLDLALVGPGPAANGAAVAGLERIVAGDAARAPGAMARLLRAQLATGRTPAARDLSAATALLAETPAGPAAPALRAALALGQAASRRIDLTIAFWRQAAESDPDAGAALAAEILSLLHGRDLEAEMLVFLAELDGAGPYLPAPLRTALTRDLADLGLPGWSADLPPGPDTTPDAAPGDPPASPGSGMGWLGPDDLEALRARLSEPPARADPEAPENLSVPALTGAIAESRELRGLLRRMLDGEAARTTPAGG